MSKASLTTFVDFVAAAGTPKFTIVKREKYREPYDPRHDFYKAIREGIIDVHSQGLPLSHLEDVCGGLTDEKKKNVYPIIVAGYKKWLGRRQAQWFNPTSKMWECGDLDVVVNPELGLTINNESHRVKLYFKSPILTKNRAEIACHLMHLAYSETSQECKMSILDVRRSKLFTCSSFNSDITIQLEGEANYWSTVWDQV